MSLEQVLQDLNGTMKELIVALKSTQAPAAVVAKAPVAPAAAKAEVKALVAEPAVVAQPVAKVATAPTPAPATALVADEAMTYEELAKVLQNLHTVKGRDALVALLTQFNAKNGKELQKEEYPAIVVAAKLAMAGA